MLYTNCHYSKPVQVKKLLLYKPFLFTVILIVSASLHVSAGPYAQGISITLQSVGLKKAMIEIEKKTEYRFLYNDAIIPSEKKVTIEANNMPVSDFFQKLFSGTGLSYRILDNNLVVLKDNPEQLNNLTDQKITGRVTNASGEPVTGASVIIKGSKIGTTTDANGNFSISVPDNNAVLIISYVGYDSQEIPVAGKTSLLISLQPSSKALADVVVIGYGTANKRDLTGSIVKVNGKDIADKPNSNPLSSVQGKVAGVSVVNSGELGKEPDIRIRGTISRTQTKPLYVVDGIFQSNIDFLNPSDIESMEILKDPSSLAIFGVRGANGVIIITTKKARTGQLTVNFSTSVGFKKLVNKIKLTDATGFKTLYNELLENQGSDPDPTLSLYNGNSDWVDLISQNGFINYNNISISQGTDKNKFYMGLGYIDEGGLIKHESQKKYLLSLNDELKVSKSLRFGFNIDGYRQQYPETQARDFSSAINATPIVEPYNAEQGVYNRLPSNIGGPQINNPLMMVDLTQGTDRKYTYRTVGSIFGELNFLQHFTFKATYYGDLGFTSERKYTPLINNYSAESGTIGPAGGYAQTQVYQSEVKNFTYQQEYLLTYKNQFGDHGLTAMAGFSTNYNNYSETNGKVKEAQNQHIPDDERFWYLDNFFADPSSKITAISPGRDIFNNPLPLEWEQATVSFLGRVLYNYKGKYMLNASFRRDGSSDISSSNRYQNFGAVGAAWEISKEDFMQDQKVFDYLKLKASWGVLGNQYTAIHYPFYPLLIANQTAVFGNNVIPGYVPSFYPNPDLKWETVTSKEIGIETRVLNNRLNLEINYFDKLTDNLLTPLPSLNGAVAGITNGGKISNNGIEITAGWSDKVSRDFTYSINANITTLNNKVKELYQTGYQIFDGPSITTTGEPIGSFFGYIQEGIYQNADDIAKSPDASALGDYGPGDIKFKDVNGDGKIDVNDRTIIGNPTPQFIYGFSLGAAYTGLDLSIDFQGVSGNDIFRNWGNGSSFAVFNFREARLGRWTGEGTSNFEPEINDAKGINKNASTYMIEDGSYLRIRNLQIGYNFTPSQLSKIHCKSLRIYLNAQNIATFKSNSGFTPEFTGTATQFGVDGGSYPVPAIYSAGINVSF